MTASEAKRLKVGDKVSWKGDSADQGEIIAILRSGIGLTIKWSIDDQEYSLHYNDCANLVKA